MNEPDLATAAATEAIKAVGKEVYEDVRPPVQAAGHALGTLMNVFNLLLAPLERAQIRSQDKTDRLRKKLAEGFEEIPPERRVEPPLEIIVPALETLKFVEDETLQDMFANLLLSAMDSETQATAHRAFVKIIEELNPYDAWLLKQICERKTSIAVRQLIFKQMGETTYWTTISYIPFLEVDKYREGEASTGLDNLIRLKLVNLENIDHKDIGIKAFGFSSDEETKAFINYIEGKSWESLRPSNILMSSLGHDFCHTCIK